MLSCKLTNELPYSPEVWQLFCTVTYGVACGKLADLPTCLKYILKTCAVTFMGININSENVQTYVRSSWATRSYIFQILFLRLFTHNWSCSSLYCRHKSTLTLQRHRLEESWIKCRFLYLKFGGSLNETCAALSSGYFRNQNVQSTSGRIFPLYKLQNLFNVSNPNGNYIYHLLQQSVTRHCVFMCFVWFSL
jgi:hypothetical protein